MQPNTKYWVAIYPDVQAYNGNFQIVLFFPNVQIGSNLEIYNGNNLNPSCNPCPTDFYQTTISAGTGTNYYGFPFVITGYQDVSPPTISNPSSWSINPPSYTFTSLGYTEPVQYMVCNLFHLYLIFYF